MVTNLLADLVSRELDASGGLLVVIDGAKALAAGVRKVFGDRALVQRCTIHKRRNVKDHLPNELGRSVDVRLARAFRNPDAAKGLQAARRLAAELQADHTDAAASLIEGLDDMFTVRRLGIDGRLALTLTNTNCIESIISGARTAMGRVKRWKDGLDEETVDRCRHARSRTVLPTGQRLQRDGLPGRCPQPPHAERKRHTPRLR